MMAKPTLLLEAHLKALRLPTFLREYDKVARHCAQEGLDCPRYLFRLCELELLDREQRATERRIKAAKFPVFRSCFVALGRNCEPIYCATGSTN